MVCEKVTPQNSFSFYLSEVVHGAAVGRQCACWRCVMVERDGLVGFKRDGLVVGPRCSYSL